MASMMKAQHELRRTNSKLSHITPRDYAPVPTVSAEDEGGKAARGPQSDLEGLSNIFGGHRILTSLLLSVPMGFAAHFMEMDPQYIFLFNFIAVIPLAWLIGKATEDVAAKVGETAGGLLNATFGNVVEMLLCISGIRNNEITVVQCTLLGSILSNLLLVMGCSFLAGGLFYPVQKYNQAGAAVQTSLLAMCSFTVGLPTIYVNILKQDAEWEHMVLVSRWTSVCLLGLYGAYLVFQLKTHAYLFEDEEEGEEEDPPDLSAPSAALLLGVATVVTSFATDYLIDALKGTVASWKVSKEFVGIILLPIIGNAAEHYTAITVAMRNKMDLSLGVAAGSSCQMALLVTPFTVIVGWIMDKEMTLNFHAFQLAVLFFAVLLVSTILSNGRSNWFEGYILLVTYVVVSIIYFFEGTGKDSSLTLID
mmetsp:Transcript_5040/g.10166  ORF Transcript_5040/g.10166 Transcript_5040/m.10166 type:complete len:421 (-) Transcript_5040:189-1451(-)|eukprot:CAMPEP_0113818014 /NCGR_PEP_ID=MMETSP0328-20130328/28_1 /TAXON_ID=39455 /ORGANISM="Alexandrium minutum" /LENGTH=420 /DNA_ID=CAMNT_0000785949 /DNA_START=160 /DNA_END=1422 /DNA_ORIENTATION=+ /assembly_acc=CAM_ASM_000350